MALSLSPYALTTVARLKSHLGRASGGESDVTDRCTAAINSATAWMERATARKLKARNWRTQFTVNLSSVVEETFNPTLLDVATAGLIRKGDDVVDEVAGLVPVGCQVAAYDHESTGATQVLLSIGTTAALSADPVTFGSRPLICSGDGTASLDVPEWPLVSLWGAYYVNADNSRTEIDTTSARVDVEAGRITLAYDVFPEGERNIELECRAGYVEPSVYDLGHPEAWNALESICLRAAEVYFTDALTLRGRATDFAMGGNTSRADGFNMPADIVDAIRPFVRTR